MIAPSFGCFSTFGAAGKVVSNDRTGVPDSWRRGGFLDVCRTKALPLHVFFCMFGGKHTHFFVPEITSPDPTHCSHHGFLEAGGETAFAP